jgi:ATPase subunit of ABC transporter with duplicated ATPase domains
VTDCADLQAFVSRFSANASKARQATSRARQIEKIELVTSSATGSSGPDLTGQGALS